MKKLLVMAVVAVLVTSVALVSLQKIDAQSAPPTQVSTFQIDLLQGLGEDPASNWYSVSGGAQILHKTDKTTGEDQFTLEDSGDVEFTEVEIVGPFVGGGTRAELLSILNNWSTQTGERFNTMLEMLDEGSQVVRIITFFDAIPTVYHPPSVRAGDDSLLEERFVFKPIRVEDAPAVRSNIENTVDTTEPVSKNADFREEILVSNNFRFEIDGKPIAVSSVVPGPLTIDLKEETMGNRPGNFKDFTVTKPQANPNQQELIDKHLTRILEPNCGDWIVTKIHDPSDPVLKEIFEQFASGDRKANPSDIGSLKYLDREGNEIRTINFYGYVPIQYESINVDSRNPQHTATETMVISVQRCEYN